MAEFKYDIESIASEYGVQKAHLKRSLQKIGFQLNIDYIVSRVTEQRHNNGGQNKENILCTKSCCDQLLQHYMMRSRKCIKVESKILQYVKRYLPKETEILDFIYDIFSEQYTIIKQYTIEKYRIDLYIFELNIAIECDEHNHKDRNIHYEQKRQQDIELTLKCKFIRFNPDDNEFKLSKLIYQIINSQHVNTNTDNIYPKKFDDNLSKIKNQSKIIEENESKINLQLRTIEDNTNKINSQVKKLNYNTNEIKKQSKTVEENENKINLQIGIIADNLKKIKCSSINEKSIKEPFKEQIKEPIKEPIQNAIIIDKNLELQKIKMSVQSEIAKIYKDDTTKMIEMLNVFKI
jgi:very-short-patch-repair endonuclease